MRSHARGGRPVRLRARISKDLSVVPVVVEGQAEHGLEFGCLPISAPAAPVGSRSGDDLDRGAHPP